MWILQFKLDRTNDDEWFNYPICYEDRSKALRDLQIKRGGNLPDPRYSAKYRLVKQGEVDSPAEDATLLENN